jgi:type II secretory pathway pseudopilin PulG
MNIRKKETGFTIIEVVLVLAIAGLIFLMVFIALPALQRNQRDTQRKNDLSRVTSALKSYESSNRGKLPTVWNGATGLTGKYLSTSGDSFIDPAGANTGQASDTTTYLFSDRSANTAPDALTGSFDSSDNQNVIYYNTGAVCADDNGSVVAAGTRKVALRVYLEGGGFACQNN